MANFLSDYWFIVAGAALYLWWYVASVIMPQMKENDLKNAYQNAGEPKLIWQHSETAAEFWAVVERERARYKDSGNAWAQKQNPVIPFPAHAAFSVEWFGRQYNLNTIGLGQREYYRAGVAFYDVLLAEWQRQVFGSFGEETMMKEVKGQEPFDPKTVWATNKN